MTRWDTTDLSLLSRASADLTALAATIEVLRRRRPTDRSAERAQRIVDRLQETVTELVERLKQ
ncbi:MAG: hypothetical protein JF886_12095 [Candidatus Dormibacteraeota bacterium]|uniref:Uncharacterized protein n=1 Tax=Candidatus Aeolococcus gillhamiae TaxID=3127015 RepID=A0A2W5ZXV7_9BACT|nr:hypothetical protein [Candidatus Dormibacteraeota bacterium]PZR78168.1 MAG: hypothetical protein DLM65_13940 [Candidatus Dormibacter sp. RRmetagenome_bin12]